MTPPPLALTPAAKRARKDVAGHRRELRRRASPNTPRRVSGPAGGRAGGALVGRRAGTALAGGRAGAPPAASRPASLTPSPAPARPGPDPVRPRPDPVRPRPDPVRPRTAPPRPSTAPAAPPQARRVGRRIAAYIHALPEHALLDRLIRGRIWIPLLGVLLSGIVAMQVEVLKYGASIGRALENTSALTSRNEVLRASVSQLGSDTRIERLASGMGMVMPQPGTVTFLTSGSRAIRRALANIQAPDAATFAASGATGAAGGGTG
jgi:hypothetical protein